MAERGLVDDILDGGEAENEAAKVRSGPPVADPIAVAAAVGAAKGDAKVSARLAAYLEKQGHLVDRQASFIDLEYEERAESWKFEFSNLRLRRFGMLLKVSSQFFLMCIVGLICAGFVLMLRDAFTSRQVVVEPFDAPPALAARGLSGKVVAAGLLDKLTQLQAATRSTAEKRNLSSAWTSDIRIEAPGTGVSIGDVQQLLRSRFGHDVHIEGDLVQNADGALALTVRGGGGVPKTFTGADLGQLDTQAAEYLYGQFEPGLYAQFLFQNQRYADAMAAIKAAYPMASADDRPVLLNVWANALQNTGGSDAAALDLYRRAIAIKPDFWVGYNNVMNATWMLGDEEGVWRTGNAMAKAAGGRPGRAPELYYQNVDYLTWNLQAEQRSLVEDMKNGGGSGTAVDGPILADVDVRLHDFPSVELELQTTPSDTHDPAVPAMIHFVHGEVALAAGDGARAASEMEGFAAAYADPAISANYPGYVCWLAPAEEMAGHRDKADAALAAGGHFVDCYRFRGDILDGRGDWLGARAAYLAAIALAPDLPAAHYSYGLALARRGALAEAVSQFAAAHQRGPRWADPLKAWGDALVRQGRASEALDLYNQAVLLAPAWGALRQARAAASQRT